MLVEHIGHHVGEHDGFHAALLAKLVHLDAISNLCFTGETTSEKEREKKKHAFENVDAQSLHVRNEAGQAHKQLVLHLKYALQIGADGDLLDAKTRVTANGHAIFAGHGDEARPVVLHDRLLTNNERAWLKTNEKRPPCLDSSNT